MIYYCIYELQILNSVSKPFAYFGETPTGAYTRQQTPESFAEALRKQRPALAH